MEKMFRREHASEEVRQHTLMAEGRVAKVKEISMDTDVLEKVWIPSRLSATMRGTEVYVGVRMSGTVP